jgi:ABC-type dipeptide/oligopeptide/nickel transport system ATPase component
MGFGAATAVARMFVSHDLGVGRQACDYILVMLRAVRERGRMVEIFGHGDSHTRFLLRSAWRFGEKLSRTPTSHETELRDALDHA